MIRFRHNDPDDLHKRLRRLKDQPGEKLIVVEGIYSMLGDTAPLKEIAARQARDGRLPDRRRGPLDGRARRDTAAAWPKRPASKPTSTSSSAPSPRAWARVGGFCVSDIDDFDLLRVVCRPYMFTASLPPSVIASTRQALVRMQEQPELRAKLTRNAQRLYDGLNALGFETGPHGQPDGRRDHARPAPAPSPSGTRCCEAGVYLNLALPPATPNGRPLLRSSVSAAHTDAQIDTAVELFAQVGRELGVLPARKRRAPVGLRRRVAGVSVSTPARQRVQATPGAARIGQRRFQGVTSIRTPVWRSIFHAA